MSKIKTIDPESVSTSEFYSYMLSAIAPRPICFASTIDKQGNVNLSPFSFFNVFSANPPILIFSVVRRMRDNTTKHTYENVKEIKEVVVNIVNYPMVEQMSLASTEYGKGVNEFTKAGFTEVPSVKIQPPRVGEAPVAFECVVDDIIELGDQGGAGLLVIAKVVLAHVQTSYLNADDKLDTEKLDLVARMGGNWYCRAHESALFEIPKPLRNKGMGVDRLPKNIRESKVLTGNDLGRLGNIEALPSVASVLKIKEEAEIESLLINYDNDSIGFTKAIHVLARYWLSVGEEEKAFRALLLEGQLSIDK